MKKNILFFVLLLLAGVVAVRGQVVNYGDSIYMFNRLDTIPPFLSSGSCYCAYSPQSIIPVDSNMPYVDQWGSIFPADSVEHIYGISIVADTMNYSFYNPPRRGKAVCAMLYLYLVPKGTSDFSPSAQVLDSVVFDVTMPYWRKMVYTGVDTLCPNPVITDTLPVYERLFSHEHVIPAGDSVLVTYLELPSPKDYPHYLGESAIVYRENIWNQPRELYWRTIHEGTLRCYWSGTIGPLFPIRHRACPEVGGVRVDTVDGTTVCLSWPSVDTAAFYRLEYGPTGFHYGGGAYSEGVVMDSISDTTVCISGLASDQVYTFFVSAYCHKMLQYGMPDSVQVLTNDNATCAPPSRFRLLYTTPTGAVVAWDTLPEQRRFEMLVKRSDETDGITVTPDSNAYELTLERGVMYSVWLRAECLHQCAVHDTVLWGPWSEPLRIRLEAQGIDEADDGGQHITIMPNPARGRATVVLREGAARDAVLRVHDAAGHEVWGTPLKAGTRSYELDLRPLAKGTYYVTLTTPAGSSTRKLVVE